MRNYITTHRVQDSYSSAYAAMEDMFIKVGEGKDGKETVYRMDKMKKNLLENFLYVRNNMLLFSKSTVDANGKTSLVDKNTGRPIYIGDGLIPQVERYADKFVYNEMSVDFFNMIIDSMVRKADNPIGNKWMFIVNETAWGQINRALGKYLAAFKTDATYMWSKDGGKYYKVGATFDTYEYNGNLISFKPDRTLTREMGQDKGFGLCLDLTADLVNGQPPVALYTIKGGDIIQNSIRGVGGVSGVDSGEVSTPVAGGAEVIMGYSGIMVANPYKSVIFRGI